MIRFYKVHKSSVIQKHTGCCVLLTAAVWLLTAAAQFGGLYVDTDFECLKSFAELHATSRWIGSLSNVGVFEVSLAVVRDCAAVRVLACLRR